jgi:heme-degrading monooxygenase HmoA
MHLRIATYRFTGDAHDIARRAEGGIAPLFQAQPGFKGYTVAEAGDRIISVSSWESAENAEAGNAAAATWVQENLADEIQLEDTHIGEILFSTLFGVSALAAART